MRIFICCSKYNYPHVAAIKNTLEDSWHTIILPNSYDNPWKENSMKDLWAIEHSTWKASMLRLTITKINDCDAILVLNFTKGNIENYIGGATFIEVFKAWELWKKIFFYNPLPQWILFDELCGMCPVIIDWDLSKIT